MKREEKYLEYSKEADEIMGTKPPWIIRWGSTILFIIFLGVIIACCFISNPLPGYSDSSIFDYLFSPIKSLFRFFQ